MYERLPRLVMREPRASQYYPGEKKAEFQRWTRIFA
jgi:hypothetical protein